MSWTHCMEKKAIHKYGPQVETCVKGITKGDFSKIAKCIADAVGDADPEKIAAELAEWSIECAL